jgi:hypothetical protein
MEIRSKIMSLADAAALFLHNQRMVLSLESVEFIFKTHDVVEAMELSLGISTKSRIEILSQAENSLPANQLSDSVTLAVCFRKLSRRFSTGIPGADSDSILQKRAGVECSRGEAYAQETRGRADGGIFIGAAGEPFIRHCLR